MARPYIGISGWTFPGWRGVFYPEDLPQKKELAYASRKLSSIEINGTFHSLQKPSSFQTWYEQTPDDFVFSVKGGQYLTHVLRLKECEKATANFFASGLLCLREKLGVILWQFPPFFTLKDDRVEKFLKLLPMNTREAAKLAKQHTEKLEGRAFTTAKGNTPIRHAFEFRHPSFLNKDFLQMLSEHNAAFVLAHAGKKSPYLDELTAKFAYLRFHGEGAKYRKGYPLKELKDWAMQIKSWVASRKDVFAYFSNDAKKYSPHGAETLLKLLGTKETVLRKAG